MKALMTTCAICVLGALISLPVLAVEVTFRPVVEGVYAYIGETDGRTYENEGLNANIGLVVTPEGAVLIDSGATFQSAHKIQEAVKKVTSQPVRWVINTGGQDHRWLGNGYFRAQGAEIMAHASAESDMKARAGGQRPDAAGDSRLCRKTAHHHRLERPGL